MLNPRTRTCIAFETITCLQEGRKAKASRNILRIERKSTLNKERMKSVRKNWDWRVAVSSAMPLVPRATQKPKCYSLTSASKNVS